MESVTRFVTYLLAGITPLLFLAVITIRYVRARQKRSAHRSAGGPQRAPDAPKLAMRRSDRVIADPARIESILRAATVCRLGFARENEPYVVPMSFGLSGSVTESLEPHGSGFVTGQDRPLRLYFHGASGGRRMEMFTANPRVCFEAEGRTQIVRNPDPCEWTVHYESVIGYGEISIVTDSGEKRSGLRCIMEHHGARGEMEFPDGMISRTTVFRLEVEEISGKSNMPGA